MSELMVEGVLQDFGALSLLKSDDALGPIAITIQVGIIVEKYVMFHLPSTACKLKGSGDTNHGSY